VEGQNVAIEYRYADTDFDRPPAFMAELVCRRVSNTRDFVMELHVGDVNPCLVVPPAICHGMQCWGGGDALVLNCPTEAYSYNDPDHHRLRYDTAEIHYVCRVSDSAKTRNHASSKNQTCRHSPQ
jgi:dTDP-4-dehydrorhamnose 3,5-epimerase-like enzyme